MAENDFQAAACSGNALSSTGPMCLGSAAGAIPAPVLFSDSIRSDLPSATNFDWNQALLLSSSGTAATLQADFVEEVSSKPYFYPEAPATLEPINQDVNRAFMVERQHHHIHMNSDSTAVNNFPPPPAHPHSSDDVNQLPSLFRFPHLLDPSSNQSPSHKHQLRYFSDNSHNTTALWNHPLIDDGGFILPPLHNYYSPNSLVPNPNKTIKSISDDVRNLNNYHPAIKKPRVETPSSLPTFKVRKEKLSDRITALQQMVSPFGKTDTASVLFEAIEYIKYLHFEVDEYLKNGNHEQEQEGRKRDLLSRGLCLVPIAALNIPISANDQSNPPHFWTHSLAESYRYITEQMEETSS